MNYYERYCGDYGRDTPHLSMTEHGAYTLMLDAYYSSERPLPADLETLYRICRARNRMEEAAVRAVADQFFPLGADGLRRNPRVEREIIKAATRINAARANGMKRKSDRADAATLAVGKPIEQANGIPTGLPTGLPDGSANENPSATIGKSPIPHAPDTATSKPKRSRQPAAPVPLPDWMPTREWEAYDDMRRAKSGKGWTLLARQMAIEEIGKLRDAGHDPVAVLRQSIVASYPGLYPPRVALAAGKPLTALAERHASNMDILTGKVRDERTVEGVAKRVDKPAVLALPSDLREPDADDVEGLRPA